jgi:dTDP-4-dehydrorhamnose reductase
MVLKLLIIGRGFLGSAIHSSAKKNDIFPIGTTYSSSGMHLDVTDIDQIDKVVSTHKPDFIVNCAALTNIDEIETNSKKAYEINSHGARNVALVAKKNRIRMAYLSTDSVFDGTKSMYNEEDVPSPINEYAMSKKLGEDLIANVLNEFIIIRTNFYGYHENGKFLFNWVFENLKKGNTITAFDDVIFNPLERWNLSDLIIELLQTNYSGILHLSSDEVLSKYKFAKKIAKELGFDETLILKGSIKNVNFVAKRPLNTSLSNQKSKKILKTKIQSLEDWLKVFNYT